MLKADMIFNSHSVYCIRFNFKCIVSPAGFHDYTNTKKKPIGSGAKASMEVLNKRLAMADK